MDVLSSHLHIFHTYQYTLNFVLDYRQRYRKSVKPSLFTVWYWHFSIKKEIGGFNKKNMLLGEQVKSCSISNVDIYPCFCPELLLPSWKLVSLCLSYANWESAHPCFLVAVVEHIYERVWGNVLAKLHGMSLIITHGNYCIHLKKG